MLFLAGAIVVTTAAILSHFLNSASDDPIHTVYIVIEQDESVDSIAERLHEEGLIRSPGYFKLRVRITDAGNDIIAGRYRLDSGMTTAEIINTITAENAALAQEISVRFTEGWRTEQFAEQLVKAGLLESTDDFMRAAADPKWNARYDFLHTRPSGVALEGYLFPDTYNFRMDATPDAIIQTLLDTFEARAVPDLRVQSVILGMSIHQVMVIASIVEREAVEPSERATIASVYYNRIAAGMPLQADPTVQYVLGRPGNWWPELTGADLQQDGRYNTYLSTGLPPGPICNPSLASIMAALYPDQTDYLYFVATGDGSHAFARTLEEHEANIERYQQGAGE
ncbi:MAG: endolytic transglycosylase MltG [Chloroflexi bacterium]|nr:MAG: endolytic transglycosylase MltG [Chloroflexota bacterium]